MNYRILYSTEPFADFVINNTELKNKTFVKKKMYESEERKDGLKMELIQKKVFDFIEHNANIKTVEKIGMNAEVK